jgi:hypothetical protein
MMAKLSVYAFLFLSLSRIAFASPSSERKFLDPGQLSKISEATEVFISQTAAMLLSPMAVPPDRIHPYSKKLTDRDRAVILESLAKSDSIDPAKRFSECKYQPGYKLSFVQKDKTPLSLIICFNCDLWAIGAGINDHQKEKIIAFGDLRSDRSQLKELTERY